MKLAREKGFEVGFDALEEDKDVYYSTPPIIDETTPTQSRTAPWEPGGGGYLIPEARLAVSPALRLEGVASLLGMQAQVGLLRGGLPVPQ